MNNQSFKAKEYRSDVTKTEFMKLRDLMRTSEKAQWKIPACQNILLQYQHHYVLMTSTFLIMEIHLENNATKNQFIHKPLICFI